MHLEVKIIVLNIDNKNNNNICTNKGVTNTQTGVNNCSDKGVGNTHRV